ncbi:MAG: hypothetical protein KUL83_00350 [Lentimicrobium sp.]|jgi:hypothetical protein|nr:hypothetical protein [Lentimicrobium sp.]MDY0025616.1 hypothetical protein [Lentimicrobium sp.]HAH60439.1 hypothetical protein [Bacteroidales bacterium]
MRIAFKNSFIRDLKKIRNDRLLSQIRNTIERVEKSNDITDISNITQLKGRGAITGTELELIELVWL